MSKITEEKSDFIVRFLTLVIMCLPDVGKILKIRSQVTLLFIG
jgi:hypothetical protein